ncbi:hypothetical protein [Thioflexithrix psekupsensis]|uniref:Crp/Fnr family transcriptional regulator n=1 Tax=Thioflexithrix psekupsensis TaxID=1570016 RepID=A0A251XBM7_9GAMM|nr:hypothetical protein [Thioflexithrix psekupsensis]OUD15547.1 hypothetical protein TPSD3_03230 [Thioflexithrix psekupsensis]
MNVPDLTRLHHLASALPAAEQAMLLAFAEFLHARTAAAVPCPAPSPTPLAIPRPAQESVVKAIKRLSQTYPMLDKSALLNEASQLLSQHVLQGRSASDVIDELEVLFQRRYELFIQAD